ncbi:hypothetical protein B296_00046982 [Ensete ventricosum]|uniref:Uncharacterized protein n=1 Tax=Ensete ventricosum TaxID=4639 RepID=A0A426WX73_ENSVE|nr:hypothetical protein B296_00046982 [Ensete ventricosum]
MRLDATRTEGSSGNVRDDDSGSVGGDMGCDHRSKVRGIANSKDSELMQGIIHGRRSVCGHPKGAEQGTRCSARRGSPEGMVVSETSSGKKLKRKVAPTGQISRRNKS